MKVPSFQVELDVFSGRPNPTWSLTEQQSQELLSRIDRLLPGVGHPPSALGYRGFIVHRIVAARPVRWLQVSAGTVQSMDKNQSRWYRDTEGIEAWLRDQAIGFGFGSLVAGEGS